MGYLPTHATVLEKWYRPPGFVFNGYYAASFRSESGKYFEEKFPLDVWKHLCKGGKVFFHGNQIEYDLVWHDNYTKAEQLSIGWD